MAVAFLHGVETFELERGPRPIQQVKSAVIGLVGTAPIHLLEEGERPPVNRPVLVLSDRDAVQFGPDTEGFTIPAALKAIFDQGAGAVFVVNCLGADPIELTWPELELPIVDGKVVLDGAFPDGPPPGLKSISDVQIALAKGGPALQGPTHFSWEPTEQGIRIDVLPGGALEGKSSAWVTIRYLVDPSPETVTSADIIGETTAAGRTGMQAWRDAASLYGFGPKVLIAPGFSSEKTVATAMQVLAQDKKLRAIALVDAPIGATRDQVLESRGPAGDLDLDLADERVLYCYPHFRVGDVLEPCSQRAAGVIAATDAKHGYWHSPSNKPVFGVTGIETPLTASINDPSCDVNALNAAGVVTVFTGYGAGIRLWGNRSSAFPGESGIKTFISVRRTIDMVDEAIEQATLRYLDGPVTEVLITSVLDDVNAFLRTLITRGALMKGSRIEFFAEDNPQSELADGHITFTKTFCPPPPAERITYKSVVDTTLLKIGA